MKHQAWVDGPEICVLEVQIYDDSGTSTVSGNALVRVPAAGTTELVPVWNCYQLPIAMWPHDLLGLDSANSDLLEVIDRNQDQVGEFWN